MLLAHADASRIIEGVAAATQDSTLSVRVPAATALADTVAAYQSAEAPATLPEAAVPILLRGGDPQSPCLITPA